MSHQNHTPQSSVSTDNTSLKTTSKPNWPLYFILIITLAITATAYQFLTVSQALVSGLLFICIAFWATSLVPAYWPALGLFTFATATQLAPNNVIFAGFSSSTFWLLFSGMIFGAAINHTGLNSRATRLLMMVLGNSYQGTIIKIAFFAMGLAFLIPSGVGRIVLIIPIIASLADHFGYDKHANGRKAMLLAAAFGTFLPAFSILPANAPNMLLSGMTEALYDTPFSYWEYLLLHFPVLGLGKLIATIIVILWLFPDNAPSQAIQVSIEKSAMTSVEKRLLWVLCGCFALWFTDALHHISAGWIGLMAALVCLWPKFGLTGKNCIDKDLQYGTLLFAAGIIGLSAIIADSGLGRILVNYLTDVIPFSPHSPLLNLSLLTFISTCVAVVTNLAGVPAIMTPMAEHLADITGLSKNAVLMTQVLAFSNVLLPYQAPPLITAIALGNLSIGAVSKVCLATFVITSLILLPINFLWWQCLSVF
ncbi:SLC13 family permease [Marinomonas profundimaris]|uniref:Sodium:sulfate symporter n=1 Tax=Marinomonas profundimaris TaxID=1208321 RepID=W1RZV7_9GAMM|nr:SLC13 family permease [Marinomonas profundimaris]ETI62315.1 sodium:sulfate symporter [Marinomonas profundimaris]